MVNKVKSSWLRLISIFWNHNQGPRKCTICTKIARNSFQILKLAENISKSVSIWKKIRNQGYVFLSKSCIQSGIRSSMMEFKLTGIWIIKEIAFKFISVLAAVFDNFIPFSEVNQTMIFWKLNNFLSLRIQHLKKAHLDNWILVLFPWV